MHIRTPHTKIARELKVKMHSHECLHRKVYESNDDDCEEFIESVNTQRYLGVVLDKNMSWEPHINELRTKLRCLAGRFYRLAEIADTRTKKMSYFALVEAILSYGITVWGGASDYLIERLERSQNSVVRNVSWTGKAATGDYRQIQILKIGELFKYKLILQNYFKSEYRTEKEKIRETRQELQYSVRRSINKYGQRSRVSCVPKLLNELPREMRNLESIGTLKKKLKEWFFECY